jgi:hypothetical protein
MLDSQAPEHRTTLTDHVDGARRLRTATTNGLIVHPPRDTLAWRPMVMMASSEKNPYSFTRALCQLYQHGHLGMSRRDGRSSENFAYQYLRYVIASLT